MAENKCLMSPGTDRFQIWFIAGQSRAEHWNALSWENSVKLVMNNEVHLRSHSTSIKQVT